MAPLMPPEETAAFLTGLGAQTSVRTLEAWRRQGKGPPWLKVQGRIRYRRTSVRDWVFRDERETALAGTGFGPGRR